MTTQGPFTTVKRNISFIKKIVSNVALKKRN